MSSEKIGPAPCATCGGTGDVIEICSACLRSACWHQELGATVCDQAKTASVIYVPWATHEESRNVSHKQPCPECTVQEDTLNSLSSDAAPGQARGVS